MISFEHKGDFKKTLTFLERVTRVSIDSVLHRYGREGVNALSQATPVNTGQTAGSWNYEIENVNGSYSIYWTNSNTTSGIPIVILLQYGHGTRGGGYVQGRDFINPAIKPIFDNIADKVWREVTKL